jgi:hypothetical protein
MRQLLNRCCYGVITLAFSLSLLSCEDDLDPKTFIEPIFCDSGIVDIDEEGNNVVINGANQVECIRAEGSCTVNMLARDIVLQGCLECIEASDEAEVNLTTESRDIRCITEGDGVLATDNAIVTLVSGNIIDIFSNQANGIRAEGASFVELVAPNQCIIEAAQSAIVEEDTAEVDTSGCNELIIQ